MTSNSELIGALRQRLEIIGDHESRRDPARHLERLRSVSEKIERLASELPQPVPPQLAHYLQRRSYDKAMEFLSANTTRRSTAR